MNKDTEQELKQRIQKLRESLTNIDQQIDQAMSQCPFIANLRNIRLSLRGGLSELEKQLGKKAEPYDQLKRCTPQNKRD